MLAVVTVTMAGLLMPTSVTRAGSPTSSRIEKDTMGPIEVPSDRLWGAQTQRSLENFRIGGERMPLVLIYALALVKRASAQVNRDLGVLNADIA
jgi:fumarate hydratase class II